VDADGFGIETPAGLVMAGLPGSGWATGFGTLVGLGF